MQRSLQYALYAFSSEADPSQDRGAELWQSRVSHGL
jgi:hypothetical protein